ncbi:hypothetical protein GCM10018952_28070 [Streptosporangium vulgare]
MKLKNGEYEVREGAVSPLRPRAGVPLMLRVADGSQGARGTGPGQSRCGAAPPPPTAPQARS